MRFTVPQFIEHEAKIIGPLTFKQLTYVGTAGVIIFILYHKNLPGHIFWSITIILALGSSALAFLKINGKPLPVVIANFLGFFSSSKIYIWQKTRIKTQVKTNIQIFEKDSYFKPLKVTRTSHLKKLNTRALTKRVKRDEAS